MSYIYDETTMDSVISSMRQMYNKLSERITRLESVKAQNMNNINTVPSDLKSKRKNMRYEGEPRYTGCINNNDSCYGNRTPSICDGNNFYDVIAKVGEHYKAHCAEYPDGTMDFQSRPKETYTIKDTLTGETLTVSIGELNQLRFMLILLGVIPAPVEKADR